VTSADVARQAGVSRGAVSQILNGHHARFSASTRARVEKVALDLGYTPSFAGRTLARGRSDGRTVLLVPEVKDKYATGLTLLHVTLRDDLTMTSLRTVLQGYRGRYNALKDVVTETEPTFRDDLLTQVPVVELMTAPLYDVADHWRTPPSSPTP